MKKLTNILLALLLLTNIGNMYLLFENNRLLKGGLASGGSNIHMNNNPDNTGPHIESNGNTIELVHDSRELYLDQNGSWIFTFTFPNSTDENLYIRSLTFIDDYLDGNSGEDMRTIDSDPMLFESMMGPEFRSKALKPGDIFNWGDGHPGEYLKHRVYRFIFIGESGTEYSATFEFSLILQQADNPFANVDYSTDQGKDLLTIRHDANFNIEVHDNIYWVPINILGTSRITNAEASQLFTETPEIKQHEVETLYEALQLYQVGGFYSSDDNIRIMENNVFWEHHKPGYHAVLTNNGCCATSANWLNYILKDDYDEVGYIATSQRDGSGHIYNYIKEGDWYYFIDLTHYRTDWIATAVESGNLDDYYKSDFVLGNLHRAKSVEYFVNYVQDMFSDAPGLMFKYMGDNCMAIDGRNEGNTVKIIYEADPDIQLEVIYDDPADQLSYVQVDPPKNHPEW